RPRSRPGFYAMRCRSPPRKRQSPAGAPFRPVVGLAAGGPPGRQGGPARRARAAARGTRLEGDHGRAGRPPMPCTRTPVPDPRAPRDPLAALVGCSPAMAALRAALRRSAASDASVLVTGETGTGKGLVARVLHAASPRAAGPFVHVDCAALAPSVIESELFGHERGAFTGADAPRVGRLEAAAGTLFRDEIAGLEPRRKAKLLRVLQERAFERVGGTRTLPLTARVVAATNRDLRRAIAAGAFRADLYYRLQVIELALPPLRARREDLPELV